MSRGLKWLVVLLLQVIFCSMTSQASDNSEAAGVAFFAQSHFLSDSGDRVLRRDALVGEKLSLVVDIYCGTWFSKAPKIEPFAVEGAVVVRTEKFATNYSHALNGETYTVQRWEYSVFPQRTGQFVVPSVLVSAGVASQAPGNSKALTTRSNALLLQASALPQSPPSSLRPDRVLSAEGLAVEQHFTLTPEIISAGDVLERRVTLKAAGSLGILIPSIRWPAIVGVRQQSSQRRINDTNFRGQMTGELSETRHYIFEQAGRYTVPALQIAWWDVKERQWQVSHLPERVITVQAGSLNASLFQTLDIYARRALAQGQGWWLPLPWLEKTMGLLGALALLLILLRFRQLLAAWAVWRSSESGLFWYLRWSLMRSNAEQVHRAYYKWLASMEGRVGRVESPPELQPLLALVYRQRADHPLRLSREQQSSFLSALNAMRNTALVSKSKWAEGSLPPLNPR